ncbi:MAG: hypothetical protein JJV96_02075 [Alphaproteobacteria bacterium]|nr:hypothetical protein [Alphaproteobacteria bacterium]
MGGHHNLGIYDYDIKSSCSICTNNKPANSYWTGSGASADTCPWECLTDFTFTGSGTTCSLIIPDPSNATCDILADDGITCVGVWTCNIGYIRNGGACNVLYCNDLTTFNKDGFSYFSDSNSLDISNGCYGLDAKCENGYTQHIKPNYSNIDPACDRISCTLPTGSTGWGYNDFHDTTNLCFGGDPICDEVGYENTNPTSQSCQQIVCSISANATWIDTTALNRDCYGTWKCNAGFADSSGVCNRVNCEDMLGFNNAGFNGWTDTDVVNLSKNCYGINADCGDGYTANNNDDNIACDRIVCTLPDGATNWSGSNFYNGTDLCFGGDPICNGTGWESTNPTSQNCQQIVCTLPTDATWIDMTVLNRDCYGTWKCDAGFIENNGACKRQNCEDMSGFNNVGFNGWTDTDVLNQSKNCFGINADCNDGYVRSSVDNSICNRNNCILPKGASGWLRADTYSTIDNCLGMDPICDSTGWESTNPTSQICQQTTCILPANGAWIDQTMLNGKCFGTWECNIGYDKIGDSCKFKSCVLPSKGSWIDRAALNGDCFGTWECDMGYTKDSSKKWCKKLPYCTPPKTQIQINRTRDRNIFDKANNCWGIDVCVAGLEMINGECRGINGSNIQAINKPRPNGGRR